jgi:DNA-binding NtrC family response regulator
MTSLKKRILCVEDHDDTCTMLKYLLPDYELVSVSTVEEAGASIRTAQFDFYLLDVKLPDGSGIDLCWEIGAIDPTTPIIFLTGAYTPHNWKAAFEAGASDFLSKPEGLEKLEETLARFSSVKCTVQQ